MLREVREQGCVGEMLEARGIIRHHVGRSWDVGGDMAVAVVALVSTGDFAEEGSRAIG